MKMRQMWVWMLLMALAFVNDRCHCCLEEERISLLAIKAWFNHAGAGSYELEGWDKEHFNCCNWDRVECDNTTNRVIELYLSGVNYEDSDLNASLFLPFKELEILDLSYNQLVGGLKNQGFQVLASGLRNLEVLDLSYNKLNDSILSSLSGFSTLKSLYLSHNSFTGTIGLKGLRNLEILYLSSNDFKESILIESLGALPSLKTLSAGGSTFKHVGEGLSNSSSLEEVFLDGSSNIPASFLRNIGPLSTLKVLSLTGVDFHGTLPAEGFQVLASGLGNLEELYLGDNKLNDSVLSSLGGFSTLKSLYLSRNSFTGSTGLNGLRNLESLNLEYTDFKESILIESLGALPSLKTLDASYSTFKHFGKGLSNSSSLEEVSLDGSSLPASFLRNIGTLSTLKVLSLTGVDFHSTLPAQRTFFNSSTLEELHLDRSSLPLNFLQNIGALPALKELYAGYCDLNGTLPAQGLRKLEILNLDLTDFKESILIESLGALPRLDKVFLDYSSLPASFLRNIGPLSTLKVLSLTGVDFHSTLPARGIFFNSSTLEELHLDGSSLPLNFLQNIGALPALKVLSAGHCDLNDTLRVQGLRNLEILYLSSNDFKESILIESLGALPRLDKVFLDYSSLPASFLRNIGPLSTLKVLSLTGVDFHSTLPARGIFFNSSTLEELHLDGSSLPLNFLQNIGALPALKVLSAGHCDLNDTLPVQGWCELKAYS
ncbi:PREDICTED: LRR receptor-like serine/threonine-protein kinase GSO1 [Populus euphratica]|uniref:LRR receptor-like serine/threonine-protein kinase GSO1 n=1 Tax=Populus euphratica TaxID=75702 RepID=A0AAJ6Y1M4_POPEU|nr:PREDICTED: LRR receptor-like serine/threonine-protein kinase GSO1 [Populus euphratica]